MTELSTSLASERALPVPSFDQDTSFQANLETHKKAVAIHIVPPMEMMQCTFWLGLFQRGRLTPSELLSNTSIETLFHEAATNGLAESGPVMLSDSSASPAKFIYLLPNPADDDSLNGEWMDNLVTTVHSWAPQKAGIYLAPELLQNEANQKLLGFIMRKLISATKTADYFVMPGTQGVNQILNTSLRIKHELESEKILVYVFH